MLGLLMEIARCPNVQRCRSDDGRTHPCRAIVGLQPASAAEFQVPEPWSGHLDSAPILFVSSNPSIGCDVYPRTDWDDERMADFFVNRFDGGPGRWVKDGRYVLLPGGEHDGHPVRYWSSVRQRAVEMLDKTSVRPGWDYALTEVVHCKSREEAGVASTAGECARLYLRRIAEASAARVVVAMGRFAESAIRREFAVTQPGAACETKLVGGTRRLFVVLPHPSAYAPKRLDRCLTADQIAAVRAALA